MTAVAVLALSLAAPVPLPAQMFPPPAPAQPPAGTPAPSGAGGAQQPPGQPVSAAELNQLVAPIALYPDSLLAQVLMASTYPLEVVQAERWAKANAKLTDKQRQDALLQQPWDASVKSLVVFPQVLSMMSEKLDWTQKLGDAFLAQPKDVMDAIQGLRGKATAEGNLKSTEQQKVATQQDGGTTYITIEPSNPEVVYVPTYNPTVVYGAWPYPTYPPYYWYPPGYVAGGALLGFTAGVIVGGALWGNCNWHGGDVNVNVNRYNNFNKTNISNGNWNHNVDHRGGVPYRDQKVAQQYGRGQAADAASRDAYRGRADAARQAGSVSANNLQSRGTMPADRGGGDRSGARGGDYSGTRGGSAFDTGRAQQARDSGNRGASSMNAARSSGNMGGGARAGGGGGARGGGGGGGRGGGGRR